MNLVKKFKESVKTKYGVEEMVLFGSNATGTANKDSDVDLIVVVKKYDKNLVAKLMGEWHEEQEIRYPVDFVQFSQKKFIELSKGINIVSQALKEGVVI